LEYNFHGTPKLRGTRQKLELSFYSLGGHTAVAHFHLLRRPVGKLSGSEDIDACREQRHFSVGKAATFAFPADVCVTRDQLEEVYGDE